MASLPGFFLFLFLLPLIPSSAQSCSKSLTFNKSPRTFDNCADLSVQSAALAWTLDSKNNTLVTLFSGVAPSSSGWVGWGINLGPSPAMAGTQAFIAFQASNGSTILTYNVTDATKSGTPLACTPIDLEVLDKQVQITGTAIAMLVTLKLKPSQTSLNLVWNRGPSVASFQPASHAFTTTDLSGLKTINVASGSVSSGTVQPPHQILKNRHGILNVVGWGILLPVGVMAARFLRPLTDPGWFYVHVFIQSAGYALGVAGWAIGLKLGSYSVGVVYRKHRIIGIVLFSIATLQVMAILLRPKKDHKIRKAWNFYHYFLGAAVLTLGIWNIFVGFPILAPPSKWRRAYVGLLIALAGIFVVLEIIRWICFCRKRGSQKDKLQGATVGGGANGHRLDV